MRSGELNPCSLPSRFFPGVRLCPRLQLPPDLFTRTTMESPGRPARRSCQVRLVRAAAKSCHSMPLADIHGQESRDFQDKHTISGAFPFEIRGKGFTHTLRISWSVFDGFIPRNGQDSRHIAALLRLECPDRGHYNTFDFTVQRWYDMICHSTIGGPTDSRKGQKADISNAPFPGLDSGDRGGRWTGEKT